MSRGKRRHDTEGASLPGWTHKLNQYRIARPRAEIRSDFDHRRRIALEDLESEESYEGARVVRTHRTGSILLPILNPECFEEDAEEDLKSYLTPVHVCPSELRGPKQGDELALQFNHDEDGPRAGGFRYAKKPVEGTGFLDSMPTPFPVDANWERERFAMAATTLVGDPRAPGPAPMDQSPPPAPPESPHDQIRPGEVWVRLRHRRQDDGQWQTDDRALFQIAPFLLQSNLAPARRLYVTYAATNHNFVYDVMEACWSAFGMTDEFDRDFHIPFSPSTSGALGTSHTVDSPSEKTLSADRVYLIDGTQYPDFWVQDQMATGYCSAPGGRAFNVVMNCRRKRPLADFVRAEMANRNDRVFTFNGLSGTHPGAINPEKGPTDYGGNIVVSPPVGTKTDAQTADRAGPRVPQHPPAPHGKIILGDCDNPNRSGGAVHADTRTFLQSQEVQPIIPIDTSWLTVGHVDEILTFVPAPNTQTLNAASDRPAKLAMASPSIMNRLLEETMKVPVEEGRTHLHRGRYNEHYNLISSIISGDVTSEHTSIEPTTQTPTTKSTWEWFNESYDEMSVEDLYKEARGVSDRIQREHLNPIEHRLRACTELTAQDILPLPVYFKVNAPGSPRALANPRTPDLVNMQILQTDQEPHLLVPRPCGPRLPPQSAKDAVTSVLRELGRSDITVDCSPSAPDNEPGFPFWAWPNLRVQALVLFFTREKPNGDFVTADERKRMIDLIKRDISFKTLQDDQLMQAVRETWQAIFNANPALQNRNPFDQETKTFNEWHRLFIPEDTVDVLALYTRSVLEELGCHVHFVDSWCYHSGMGTTHCATEVLHEPPTADSTTPSDRPPWWETYPDLAAKDVDTTYDPSDTNYK